jgi:hypothetical protein
MAEEALLSEKAQTDVGIGRICSRDAVPLAYRKPMCQAGHGLINRSENF